MIHEYCEQCGFDGGEYDAAGLLNAIRALGPQWRALLDRAGPELRRRPRPEVWSPIEYAAHSLDITALHVYGVEQALTVDEPVFPAIEDGLVEAAASRYAGADPDEVTAALATEATRLADLGADAGEQAWTRGLTIGSERRDVRGLLEHALHDSVHHLDDVARGLTGSV
jgi:hypothetical protein